MEEKQKPRPWLWWTVAGLILLVAYPLSLGPVAWGYERLGFDNDDTFIVTAIKVFYFPLIQVVENSPGFRGIYRPYNDWWLN